MKIESLRTTFSVLACAGMLLQPVAMAAPQAPPITDIALQSGGVLVGQIASDQGQPLVNAPVSIIRRGKEIAQVATDRHGAFAIPNLQGGVYQVATAGQRGVYRLWAPHTAPPSARQGLALVSGDVVRGQEMGGSFSRFAGWVKNHPLMTGGIVAAAIAIPLAIDNNNNDSGPSS